MITMKTSGDAPHTVRIADSMASSVACDRPKPFKIISYLSTQSYTVQRNHQPYNNTRYLVNMVITFL